MFARFEKYQPGRHRFILAAVRTPFAKLRLRKRSLARLFFYFLYKWLIEEATPT